MLKQCLQIKEVKREPKISYPVMPFFKYERYKQNSGNAVYMNPS